VTNVLVVDDSAVVRQEFSQLLGRQFAIETAADALIAEQKIRRHRPDVVVLDLQMPQMDGLTFLRRIMTADPLPVVICSAGAARGSETAMRALHEGAVDIILKPQLGVQEFLRESAVVVADTLRAASQARVVRRLARAANNDDARAIVRKSIQPRPQSTQRIIAAGASTGGTEALREIIEALPEDAPPMVVVQHMPAGFTTAFARRLDSLARVSVKEAEAGDELLRGRVLIAPGDRHMIVLRHGFGYRMHLGAGPLVSRHRPSVDVLFRSVAQSAGANAIGVLLTGMGDDGADGMAELHEAGSRTIAQDEATSVVFGMPKEAVARGAVDEILPLASIAARIRELS